MYWNMSDGEKKVTRAFMRQYMEEAKKEAEELKNG